MTSMKGRTALRAGLGALALVLAPFLGTPEARAQEAGYLHEWLLCGPFPFAQQDGRLAFDPIRGEAAAIPAEGRLAGGERWRTCRAGEVLDFLAVEAACAIHENGVVYAHVFVRARAERKLTLAVGSDDGVAIWVNGARVAFNDVYRGVTKDQDKVPVTLVAGWNRVLFKVSQGVGGWGLAARFLDGNESAAELEVQAKNPDPEGAFADAKGPPRLLVVGERMEQGALAVRVLNVGGAGTLSEEILPPEVSGKLLEQKLPAIAPGEIASVKIAVPLETLLGTAFGDEAILPLAARGAVAPVVSFVLGHVAPEATCALALAEPDRAALLRAENALARMGRPAVLALVGELERASGAREQVLARALGEASVRSLRDPETARRGASVLASHRVALVREHLLLSGRTTEPTLDPEYLPELLGRLVPASFPAIETLLEKDATLAVRALAHAAGARDEAAHLLSKRLAVARDPRERWRIGRALSKLGGESAVLALEHALQEGPADERWDRIVDLEATRDAGAAPKVLARNLDRLSPEEQVRAFEAIEVCAVPPPPPPKARFVVDPFARRRTKDARESRARAREAALAHLGAGTPVPVRRAAARALETLGKPESAGRGTEHEAQKEQQALAHALLEVFEKEPVLAVSCEEARALVELTPVEVLAAPFRAAVLRVLALRPDPALPALALGDGALALAERVPLDAASRDRFVHAVLEALGEEDGDEGPLVAIVKETALDPAARARAAAALARLGASGRAQLDQLGDSEDEIARACARTARAGALASDQTDLLQGGVQLGANPQPLLRRARIAILAYAGGKAAQGFVQGFARNDPSPLVRLEGTKVLARVYGKPAAGVIAQALLDPSPAVRREAARALGHLGEPNVGNILCVAIDRAKKLPDPDQAAEEESFFREALSTLGKDSVPTVGGHALNAGPPTERRIAIAQLGRIATDEAIAFLMLIARNPKTPEDRDAAGWALERATGRDLTDSMWAPLRGH